MKEKIEDKECIMRWTRNFFYFYFLLVMRGHLVFGWLGSYSPIKSSTHKSIIFFALVITISQCSSILFGAMFRGEWGINSRYNLSWWDPCLKHKFSAHQCSSDFWFIDTKPCQMLTLPTGWLDSIWEWLVLFLVQFFCFCLFSTISRTF